MKACTKALAAFRGTLARERAGIRFAEKLAVDHQKVDDALWTERRRHFSEAEIIGIEPA